MKIFFRIVAVLLVPCLMADSLSASAYSRLLSPVQGVVQARFQEEALAPVVLEAHHILMRDHPYLSHYFYLTGGTQPAFFRNELWRSRLWKWPLFTVSAGLAGAVVAEHVWSWSILGKRPKEIQQAPQPIKDVLAFYVRYAKRLVVVEGAENFLKNGSYLAVANHWSKTAADFFVLANVIADQGGRIPKILITTDSRPLLADLARRVLQHYGIAILVPGKAGSKKGEVSGAATYELKTNNKTAVLISPAGHAELDPEKQMLNWHTGVVRISRDSGKPIVPIAISGPDMTPEEFLTLAWEIRDQLYFRPLFHIRIGRPISFDHTKTLEENLNQLNGAVRDLMRLLPGPWPATKAPLQIPSIHDMAKEDKDKNRNNTIREPELRGPKERYTAKQTKENQFFKATQSASGWNDASTTQLIKAEAIQRISEVTGAPAQEVAEKFKEKGLTPTALQSGIPFDRVLDVLSALNDNLNFLPMDDVHEPFVSSHPNGASPSLIGFPYEPNEEGGPQLVLLFTAVGQGKYVASVLEELPERISRAEYTLKEMRSLVKSYVIFPRIHAAGQRLQKMMRSA